ncbi:MAG: hypothetical protein U0270_44195 [Labilithrix sp.]
MRARFLLVLVGALLAPRVAAAAPESNGVTLFKEAKALLAQGRFELACQRFAESNRAEPSVGALLNIADCQERQGKLVAAHASCLAAHDLAVRKSDPDRATFAENRAKELDARTARLYLELPEPNAKDLLVTLDDAPIRDNGRSGPVPIDPGVHHLQATAAGRSIVAREVSVSASEREVRVKMPPFAEPAPSAGRPALSDVSEPRPAPEAEPRANLALPSFLIAGGLVAGGLVTGAFAITRWDGFLEQCPDRKCATQAVKDAASSDHDAASFFATTSTVLCAGGIAFAALGAYFHYFHDDRHARIVPAVGPRTAGAQLDYSF